MSIATANPTLLSQITYSAGASPIYMAVADFNNDSIPDIIVADFTTSNVGVLLNAGNSTFSAPTSFSTGLTPQRVAVADVTNDSKIDIIVANVGDASVDILLAC